MKKTLTRRITILTAAAFLIIAIVMGLFLGTQVRKNTRETINKEMTAAIGMVAQFYEGIDLEKITPELSSLLTEFFAILQDNLGLDNIYIMIPNFENNTLKYVSIRTNDGSRAFISKYGEEKGVIQEGSIHYYEITERDKEIYKNGGMKEIDNQYGHTYACFAPIYTDSTQTEVAGVAGVEVSAEAVERSWIRLFIILYSIFVFFAALTCIAVNIFFRKNVLKRTEHMSSEMQRFTESGINALSEMHIESKGKDELDKIADSFNTLTENLKTSLDESKELRLEKQKIETEIELAGKIQMDMLHDPYFKTNGVCINASLVPAISVGGDFYYYGEDPNGKIFTAVGDVTGKGVMAAMLMTKAITMMTALVNTYHSPKEIAQLINYAFSIKNTEALFVTIFVEVYDPKTGTLTYCDAGHNPPYLIHENGQFEKIESQIDMMTGIFPDSEYHETTIQLEKGDRVFLYTDGVNEAENPDKEQFGYERMEEVLSQNPENIIESMTSAVAKFAGNADQSDDITMLVMTVE